jgi:hypothetical protein
MSPAPPASDASRTRPPAPIIRCQAQSISGAGAAVSASTAASTSSRMANRAGQSVAEASLHGKVASRGEPSPQALPWRRLARHNRAEQTPALEAADRFLTALPWQARRRVEACPIVPR